MLKKHFLLFNVENSSYFCGNCGTFFPRFFLLQNSEDKHLFEIKMYALTVTFEHLNWPKKK